MSTWVGISPVIGAGSLDGFAIGAMMSGAFFLAFTAPRRAQRRQAAAASAGGAPSAGPRAWLRERVAAVTSRAVISSGSEAPSPVAASAAPAPDGKAAGHRSRHRLGNPAPGGLLPLPEESSPDAAPRRRAIPDSAFLGGAFPGSAFLAGPPEADPQPDDQVPDIEFPDGTHLTSKRPDTRRLPRHAAPTVRLSSKLGHRVAGLLAARPLASGARG
jgi:hypothetical protein